MGDVGVCGGGAAKPGAVAGAPGLGGGAIPELGGGAALKQSVVNKRGIMAP